MYGTTLSSLLLLPAVLRMVIAQNTTSTACNNSPSLCDRSYNNITHLGAHDSLFVSNSSNGYTDAGNQFYSSTAQLSAGVRLLSAQVHQTNTTGTNEYHLCHTSCALYDAGKLSTWLGDIKAWLNANTNDVVTILLVNSDNASADDLALEYEEAGLADYSYIPPANSATKEWPTLQTLISNGTRLMNFVAAVSDNSGAPYLMDEWTYVFENNYDVTDPSNFSCTANRPSSDTAGSLLSGMMPLMNHFLDEEEAFGIEIPDTGNITSTNAPGNDTGNLGSSARQCADEYGQAPTFILVDFFNVGPAIETVDELNGVSNAVGRSSVTTAVVSETSAGIAPNAGLRILSLLAIATVVVWF